MTIKNGVQADWEKFKSENSDPYGAGVIRYAIKWAELMEEKIKAGEIITIDLAKQLSKEADEEGITGMMFALAKKVLYTYWKCSNIFSVEGWGVL